MAESSTTVQKVSAEVIGTFILVFFGCGTAIFTQGQDSAYVTIGLAFGLTVLVGAYAFGRISGAHFNPAVSVGAALGGRMAWRQVPVYIASQLAGALVAGLVLFVLVHGFDGYSIKANGLGQDSFGDQGSGVAWWAAFLLELIMTAIFVWVILAVTDERNQHPALAPAAIGLALAMIHFASVAVTGTSVNPARSIGVAVFAGSDAILQLWLFILAPLVGAAAAGLTYPLIFGYADKPVPGSGLTFGGRPAVAAVAPGYGATDQFQQEWNQGYAGSQTEEQGWSNEPIIQDGWQWDHAAQEWKPLEQWQPAAGSGYAQGGYEQGGYEQGSYEQTGYPQTGYDQAGSATTAQPAATGDDTQIAAPPVTDDHSPYQAPTQRDQPGSSGQTGSGPQPPA